MCFMGHFKSLWIVSWHIYTAADFMSCDHKAWTRMWKWHFFLGFLGVRGDFSADFSFICSQTEVIWASSQTGQHLSRSLSVVDSPRAISLVRLNQTHPSVRFCVRATCASHVGRKAQTPGPWPSASSCANQSPPDPPSGQQRKKVVFGPLLPHFRSP